MSNRLRVLIVSPTLPTTAWGFGTRVYHLARHLSRNHSVTMLSYGRDDEAGKAAGKAEALRDMGCEVRVVPRDSPGRVAKRAAQLASLVSTVPFGGQDMHTAAMQQALNELLLGDRFDVVQLESSQMCGFRIPGGAALVVDEHNVEYELLQRMGDSERSGTRRFYNRFEQVKFRRFEQRCWLRVDGCVLTSEREAAIVARHAPDTPTVVVPNAVDPDFFVPCHDAPEPDTMVFTGLLTYRPNLDAVRHLVDDVMPLIRRQRPGARLTIVGHGPAGDLESLRRQDVTVTGWVADVRPYVAKASVVVVPLRIGGGTRLKVVESLAMAKPIVSTTLGCEGLAVRDREHIAIGDGAEQLAARTVELLANPEAGRSLGLAGRSLVVSRYSWDQAGAHLEELYRRVARPRLRAGGPPKVEATERNGA